MLDEPAAGLDPDAVAELGATLRRLVADGLGLLLVEHDIDLVARVADDVVALEAGRAVRTGSYAQVVGS